MAIQDGNFDNFAPYVYEGSFVDIPEELLCKKVVDYGRIIESSEPERKGAYSLTI